MRRGEDEEDKPLRKGCGCPRPAGRSRRPLPAALAAAYNEICEVFFGFGAIFDWTRRSQDSRCVLSLKLDEVTVQKNGSNKKHHAFLNSIEEKQRILEFHCGFYGFLEYFPAETAIALCRGRVHTEGADAPALRGNTLERLRETQIILFSCHPSDLTSRIQSPN